MNKRICAFFFNIKSLRNAPILTNTFATAYEIIAANVEIRNAAIVRVNSRLHRIVVVASTYGDLKMAIKCDDRIFLIQISAA